MFLNHCNVFLVILHCISNRIKPILSQLLIHILILYYSLKVLSILVVVGLIGLNKHVLPPLFQNLPNSTPFLFYNNYMIMIIYDWIFIWLLPANRDKFYMLFLVTVEIMLLISRCLNWKCWGMINKSYLIRGLREWWSKAKSKITIVLIKGDNLVFCFYINKERDLIDN
jgi:hypothetical protein